MYTRLFPQNFFPNLKRNFIVFRVDISFIWIQIDFTFALKRVRFVKVWSFEEFWFSDLEKSFIPFAKSSERKHWWSYLWGGWYILFFELNNCVLFAMCLNHTVKTEWHFSFWTFNPNLNFKVYSRHPENWSFENRKVHNSNIFYLSWSSRIIMWGMRWRKGISVFEIWTSAVSGRRNWWYATDIRTLELKHSKLSVSYRIRP